MCVYVCNRSEGGDIFSLAFVYILNIYFYYIFARKCKQILTEKKKI